MSEFSDTIGLRECKKKCDVEKCASATLGRSQNLPSKSDV
jgi:hypothetical protein